MVFANRTLLQHDFFSHPVSNRNHIYTSLLFPHLRSPWKQVIQGGHPITSSHSDVFNSQVWGIPRALKDTGAPVGAGSLVRLRSGVQGTAKAGSRHSAVQSLARDVAWYAVCAGNVFANEFDAIGKGDAAARVGVVGEMLTCNRVLEFYSIINQH